jgi:large subunit ribosomal protein L18
MSLRTIRRRRRECKTDYGLRMGLLKSSLPRVIIRKTNKYFIIQVVESSEAQDKITFGITSKALLDYGWDEKSSGSLKSISAGYLTGILAAKKIGNGEFIIDLGMAINHKGGRMFSIIAGLIDGGLNIRANPKVLPSKERLMGEHLDEKLKDMIVKVKAKVESASGEVTSDKKKIVAKTETKPTKQKKVAK